VSITRIRVRSPRAAVTLLRRLTGIRRQLDTTAGLSTWALRAQPLRMTFTTYGVFEDRRALAAFVRSAAHAEAMTALRGRIPAIASRTMTRRGADLPRGWRAIDAALDAPRPVAA
jgi:hypothetical protein